MKPSPQDLLPVYRRNLEKYLRDGDDARVAVQRALLANLEKRAA